MQLSEVTGLAALVAVAQDCATHMKVAHFQGVKLSSRNLETSVQLTDVTLLLVKGEIFTSDIPQGDDVQVIMPYIFPKIPDEVPNYRLI